MPATFGIVESDFFNKSYREIRNLCDEGCVEKWNRPDIPPSWLDHRTGKNENLTLLCGVRRQLLMLSYFFMPLETAFLPKHRKYLSEISSDERWGDDEN